MFLEISKNIDAKIHYRWSIEPPYIFLKSLNYLAYNSWLYQLCSIYFERFQYNKGNIIIVFSIPVQCNNNNYAEILVDDYGIEWYINLQIEFDSLVIVNKLRHKSTNNMKIKHIVDRVINLLTDTNHYFLTILEKEWWIC